MVCSAFTSLQVLSLPNLLLNCQLQRLSAGNTLVHIAAQYTSVSALKVLLLQGADPLARNHRFQTPLHVLAERTLCCAHTAQGSHSPASQCRVLEKVDTFLRVKHVYQGVYREAFLAAMDATDVDGCKPVWSSRLDKARYGYWRVAVAMMLAPEELSCSTRAGGHLGMLRCATSYRGLAIADLPVELRKKILGHFGIFKGVGAAGQRSGHTLDGLGAA